MKNLMIYMSPTGSFDNPRADLTSNDAGALVKVQIENSLALGWKAQDILLVTNFKFAYGPIQSHVLHDVPFFERKPQATKINAILKLFEQGLITENEVYWFHDLDAYQLEPLDAGIDLSHTDMALTDYGGAKVRGIEKWHTASIFFNTRARDIFERLKEVTYQKNTDEETALCILTVSDKTIERRIQKLNNTYNFNGFNLKKNYDALQKPIKVLHFHPHGYIKQLHVEKPLDFFLGENELHLRLLPERLNKLFKYHHIR